MAEGESPERAVELLRDAAARVRADHEHGASWLARAAAAALDEAAGVALAGVASDASGNDLGAFWQAARDLAHARPSMAAIATTVARICAAGQLGEGSAALDAADALCRMGAAARRLASAWDAAAGAITIHAPAELRGTVLTHSRSGTVERVLSELAAEGQLTALTVTTSQPGGEGIALAEALARRGVQVTLVADAAMGWAVAGVNAIVLGADSVRADGSLINKVGSLPLALCARHAGVPVYVLCESLKIAPGGWPLTLEVMDPAEIVSSGPRHLHPRNPYFDHTPAELITAVITEAGPLSREEIAAIAEATARELAELGAL